MTNKIEDGGPAFPFSADGPTTVFGQDVPEGHKVEFYGMSLRDYFAASALAGELASPTLEWGDGMHGPLATNAYKFADALLEARK